MGAYPRTFPPAPKKVMLLFAFLLLGIGGFAQDAEGYFDIKRKQPDGSTLRYICSPDSDIQNHFGRSLENKPYVTYKNSLAGINKQVKYRFGFTIFDKFPFSIPQGGRLLLKFKNGQTATLTTSDYNECEYKNINGIDTYWVTASYVVPTKTLDKIISVGVTKIRIETKVRNYDIEPERDFADLTKEFKTGIYTRYNNKQDTFTSDF